MKMKNLFVAIFSIGLLCVAPHASMAHAASPALDEAVQTLVSFRPGDGRQRFFDARDVVRERLGQEGSPEEFRRLLVAASDERVPYEVRMSAVTLCFDLSQRQENADAVITGLLRWSDAIDAKAATEGPVQSIVSPEGDAWRRAMQQLRKPKWIELIGASPDRVKLAQWLCLSDAASHFRRFNPGLLLLTQAHIDEKTQSAIALDIVRSPPSLPGEFSDLIVALSPNSMTDLMQIVRESGTTLITINRLAVDVLAHLGRQEIKAYLQTLRPKFVTFSDPAYPRLSRQAQWFIDTSIAKVDLQQSNDSLLTFIASVTDPAANLSLRLWAIGRVEELGATREEIRHALLTHEKQVRALGAAKLSRAQRSQRLSAIVMVKSYAIAHGFLEESDWPDAHYKGVLSLPAQADQ